MSIKKEAPWREQGGPSLPSVAATTRAPSVTEPCKEIGTPGLAVRACSGGCNCGGGCTDSKQVMLTGQLLPLEQHTCVSDSSLVVTCCFFRALSPSRARPCSTNTQLAVAGSGSTPLGPLAMGPPLWRLLCDVFGSTLQGAPGSGCCSLWCKLTWAMQSQ